MAVGLLNELIVFFLYIFLYSCAKLFFNNLILRSHDSECFLRSFLLLFGSFNN